MTQRLMTQKPKTRITSWLLILALMFFIPGCGGGNSESLGEQQAKGGLGEPIIIGPPDPGAPAVYSVKLAWDAVTKNVDGTDCIDLAGYKVYYGTSSGVFTTDIDVGNVITYTIPNLSRGTYYFAVKAYDTDTNFSEYSSPTYGLCVNVDATPTPCPK